MILRQVHALCMGYIDPHSDSSTFRHFLADFGFPSKFVPKFRGKTKIKFQKSAKHFFLSKYVPKLCPIKAESLASANYLLRNDKCQSFQYFFGKTSAK